MSRIKSKSSYSILMHDERRLTKRHRCTTEGMLEGSADLVGIDEEVGLPVGASYISMPRLSS